VELLAAALGGAAIVELLAMTLGGRERSLPDYSAEYKTGQGRRFANSR
jgi:hypothetical protein